MLNACGPSRVGVSVWLPPPAIVVRPPAAVHASPAVYGYEHYGYSYYGHAPRYYRDHGYDSHKHRDWGHRDLETQRRQGRATAVGRRTWLA